MYNIEYTMRESEVHGTYSAAVRIMSYKAKHTECNGHIRNVQHMSIMQGTGVCNAQGAGIRGE